MLPQGIKLQNKKPCQLPTHQLQAGEGGRREFSWQRPQVASRQTTRGISSEDGPELASPTPNTRTLGIAGGGLVAFWRHNFCQMIFSIMGGVGHISHTYQSGCPSTGSLGCLDTSRASSSKHHRPHQNSKISIKWFPELSLTFFE